MKEKIFISLSRDELETLIIDCLAAVIVEYDKKKPKKEDEEHIDIKQASIFLGLAVPTIYGLISKNDIPYSKKGRKLYFYKSELTTWIKAGKRKNNMDLDQEANNIVELKPYIINGK